MQRGWCMLVCVHLHQVFINIFLLANLYHSVNKKVRHPIPYKIMYIHFNYSSFYHSSIYASRNIYFFFLLSHDFKYPPLYSLIILSFHDFNIPPFQFSTIIVFFDFTVLQFTSHHFTTHHFIFLYFIFHLYGQHHCNSTTFNLNGLEHKHLELI